MATAHDARDWARSGLHGIGDSLYTPFSGVDGDDIDWDAYRTLVRYCVGDLRHDMLWLTSGIAEWWSLTMPERKQLLEVAVDEARTINPDVVIQACTSATSAKDALELTAHAQEHGADIAFIQTPPMEVHGGEGVLRFFQYLADRTDLALGMFNSPSSGYVLTPAEMAAIYDAVPAVVAVKEGVQDSILPTLELHALAPGQLIWDGALDEARAFWKTSSVRSGLLQSGGWTTLYPGRPDYFTHWGEAYKLAASVIGLPVGDYPYSRPPQVRLPEHAREQIRTAYEASGMAGMARAEAIAS